MQVAQEWQWPRPLKNVTVEIESGHVKYNELREPYQELYFPLKQVNLPNKLAKVESQRDITPFVEKWGLLGFQKLKGEGNNPAVNVKGDPVDWFLQQAKTVKFALLLINALQEEEAEDRKEKTLKGLILNNQVKVASLGDMLAHVFAEGPEIRVRPSFKRSNTGEPLAASTLPFQPETYKGFAAQLVSHLVNVNTKGVNRKIGLNREGGFVSLISSRSLIETIWYHIGNTALNSKGKRKEKGTRLCEECETPFIVTDNRQRFCPGDEFSKGSLCGARYRVRENRL